MQFDILAAVASDHPTARAGDSPVNDAIETENGTSFNEALNGILERPSIVAPLPISAATVTQTGAPPAAEDGQRAGQAERRAERAPSGLALRPWQIAGPVVAPSPQPDAPAPGGSPGDVEMAAQRPSGQPLFAGSAPMTAEPDSVIVRPVQQPFASGASGPPAEDPAAAGGKYFPSGRPIMDRSTAIAAPQRPPATDGRPVVAPPQPGDGVDSPAPALDGRPIVAPPTTAATAEPLRPLPAEASRPPVVPTPQEPRRPQETGTTPIQEPVAGADGAALARAGSASGNVTPGPATPVAAAVPTAVKPAAHAVTGLTQQVAGTPSPPGAAATGSTLSSGGRPAALNGDTVPAQVLRQLPQAPPAGGGEQRLTVQLNPEHLGRIEVRLVASEGRLEVVLQADVAASAQVLRDSLQDLARALGSKFEGRWQHVEVRLNEPAGSGREGRDPAAGDEDRPGDRQRREGRDGQRREQRDDR